MNLYQFLSTLSLRRATVYVSYNQYNNTFLSTLSLRRATVHYDNYNLHCVISIHALLAESDGFGLAWLASGAYFYPRSPCGERRWLRCWQLAARDISIHALLAESDLINTYHRIFGGGISIHALLAESDALSLPSRAVWIISIHALLAESDFSTSDKLRMPSHYFYPRSPCGERPKPGKVKVVEPGIISIHALLAESDERQPLLDTFSAISIHALLAESDHNNGWHACCRRDFYPRSPCGERRKIPATDLARLLFLSTLSLRRATKQQDNGLFSVILFLSTLSLRRATAVLTMLVICPIYFYPRSPCGERPSLSDGRIYKKRISIHALLTESDA